MYDGHQTKILNDVLFQKYNLLLSCHRSIPNHCNSNQIVAMAWDLTCSNCQMDSSYNNI